MQRLKERMVKGGISVLWVTGGTSRIWCGSYEVGVPETYRQGK